MDEKQLFNALVHEGVDNRILLNTLAEIRTFLRDKDDNEEVVLPTSGGFEQVLMRRGDVVYIFRTDYKGNSICFSFDTDDKFGWIDDPSSYFPNHYMESLFSPILMESLL